MIIMAMLTIYCQYHTVPMSSQHTPYNIGKLLLFGNIEIGITLIYEKLSFFKNRLQKMRFIEWYARNQVHRMINMMICIFAYFIYVEAKFKLTKKQKQSSNLYSLLLLYPACGNSLLLLHPAGGNSLLLLYPACGNMEETNLYLYFPLLVVSTCRVK